MIFGKNCIENFYLKCIQQELKVTIVNNTYDKCDDKESNQIKDYWQPNRTEYWTEIKIWNTANENIRGSLNR